jgi:hypothetical protein
MNGEHEQVQGASASPTALSSGCAGSSPVPGLAADALQSAGAVFEFEAPAGTRILGRDFFGINVGWASPCPDEETLWWIDDRRRWATEAEIDADRQAGRRYGLSSCAPCRSFKAFRRHVRKHAELAGRRAVLVSRWVGNNVIAHIASCDRSGEAGETRSEAKGLDAEHESAVGAEGAETPNLNSQGHHP